MDEEGKLWLAVCQHRQFGKTHILRSAPTVWRWTLYPPRSQPPNTNHGLTMFLGVVRHAPAWAEDLQWIGSTARPYLHIAITALSLLMCKSNVTLLPPIYHRSVVRSSPSPPLPWTPPSPPLSCAPPPSLRGPVCDGLYLVPDGYFFVPWQFVQSQSISAWQQLCQQPQTSPSSQQQQQQPPLPSQPPSPLPSPLPHVLPLDDADFIYSSAACELEVPFSEKDSLLGGFSADQKQLLKIVLNNFMEDFL